MALFSGTSKWPSVKVCAADKLAHKDLSLPLLVTITAQVPE